MRHCLALLLLCGVLHAAEIEKYKALSVDELMVIAEELKTSGSKSFMPYSYARYMADIHFSMGEMEATRAYLEFAQRRYSDWVSYGFRRSQGEDVRTYVEEDYSFMKEGETVRIALPEDGSHYLFYLVHNLDGWQEAMEMRLPGGTQAALEDPGKEYWYAYALTGQERWEEAAAIFQAKYEKTRGFIDYTTSVLFEAKAKAALTPEAIQAIQAAYENHPKKSWKYHTLHWFFNQLQAVDEGRMSLDELGERLKYRNGSDVYWTYFQCLAGLSLELHDRPDLALQCYRRGIRRNNYYDQVISWPHSNLNRLGGKPFEQFQHKLPPYYTRYEYWFQ